MALQMLPRVERGRVSSWQTAVVGAWQTSLVALKSYSECLLSHRSQLGELRVGWPHWGRGMAIPWAEEP
jgi:hypothetical protein